MYEVLTYSGETPDARHGFCHHNNPRRLIELRVYCSIWTYARGLAAKRGLKVTPELHREISGIKKGLQINVTL